jgi:hypothetical protein
LTCDHAAFAAAAAAVAAANSCSRLQTGLFPTLYTEVCPRPSSTFGNFASSHRTPAAYPTAAPAPDNGLLGSGCNCCREMSKGRPLAYALLLKQLR